MIDIPQNTPASRMDDEKHAAPKVYSRHYITKYGKKKMSFFAPQELLNELKKSAKKRNMTTSQQIRDSIQLYLHVCEQQEKEHT